MREAYGVPVVESAEELPRVVAELGVVPWRHVLEPVDLAMYRQQIEDRPIMRVRTASKEEFDRHEVEAKRLAARRRKLERFAPRAEVLYLMPPGGTETDTYCRSVGRNGVTVFTTVPDRDLGVEASRYARNLLVPVVAEWKHGAEVTVIGPPCGMLEKDESPRDCALREFREETGFELADAVPLTAEGLAVSARQSTQQYFPFLGRVKVPIARGETHLDSTEHLKLVLVRLPAWVDFILSGVARDDNAYAVTFLALHKMGLLQVGYPRGRGLIGTV